MFTGRVKSHRCGITEILCASRAVFRQPGWEERGKKRRLPCPQSQDTEWQELSVWDLERIEQEASAKMASFPALTRDVFQSFYSLMPRRQETDHLSAAAQRFNAPILDHVLAHEDYPTLKAVCEGRELPAYEAAEEFITKTAGSWTTCSPVLAGTRDL